LTRPYPNIPRVKLSGIEPEHCLLRISSGSGEFMNFLFHLYLSSDDPNIIVGNFMGDFVKGRVDDEHPHAFGTGIMLHRRIDSFAQHDPFFSRSRQRLAPQYGLYRGVMVDLFYDHFLAAEWMAWSEEPLDLWLRRIRGVVERRRSDLPEHLRTLLPVIFDELLPSYHAVEGIGRAFERMSRRMARPNPLAGGERELVAHYEGLRDDFRGFMPEVKAFAAQCRFRLT
jgi:acyl carrier protein phosphodiesterase